MIILNIDMPANCKTCPFMHKDIFAPVCTLTNTMLTEETDSDVNYTNSRSEDCPIKYDISEPLGIITNDTASENKELEESEDNNEYYIMLPTPTITDTLSLIVQMEPDAKKSLLEILYKITDDPKIQYITKVNTKT